MSGYIGTRAAVASPGTERKKTFAITTTTTNLTGLSYTPGFVHVYHNGIRLVDSTDYTATDGSTITLTTAAENGDEVVVVSYGTFSPADTYTKSETYTKTEADDRYVNASGDTMTGNLLLPNLGVDTNDDAASLRLSANDTQATSGVAIQLWGKDMGSWGGGIHYIADTRGVDGRHRFWTWDGSTFVNRASIDEAGRVTMPYQPSFRALSPATGNYTTVSGGIIPFNATSHNIGGHFNTSTYRFTAPVAGTYLFCFSGFNNGASGERISIVVNGSTRFAQGSRYGGYNDWDNTAIFYLSVNDFVDVRATYGGATIYLAPAHTEFAGFFLG